MAHIFKVGDKARLIGCKSHKEMDGREVIIKSAPYVFTGDLIYEVEFTNYDDPSPNVPFRAVTDLLEPILPPDTYTVTTWAQYPFEHPEKYLEGVAA